MFDWEKRLKELSGYGIGFEIKDGYYHISIVFDDNWQILEPENTEIYVEKRNGTCHYICQTDKITIAEIFNAVDATIEYNMDLERKLLLFKKKTEELQEIFASETLEVLETIEFKYGIETEKKKRGRTPKKQEKTNTNTKAKRGKKKTKEQPKEKEGIVEVKDENIQENNFNIEEDNKGFIDNNDDEIIMAEDGFFEELER